MKSGEQPDTERRRHWGRQSCQNKFAIIIAPQQSSLTYKGKCVDNYTKCGRC